MKKKSQWYKDPYKLIITVALMCSAIVVIANYINLPKITEALAMEQKQADKRIDAIERYIEVNQAILESNQKRQQEPEYTPPKGCWEDGGDGYDYPVSCDTGNWL